MDEPTGKRCTKCGEVKPLEEFGRDRKRRDGRTYRCRVCLRQEVRERRAANPEASREAVRRWRAANLETARQCTRESMRRWAEANPETARENSLRWYRTYRAQVFDHYGRQCACCGAADRLTIDHVNGDGRQHREEIGSASSTLYRWLIANGFPPGFQALCLSCNNSKGTGDRCRLNHLAEIVKAAAGIAVGISEMPG